MNESLQNITESKQDARIFFLPSVPGGDITGPCSAVLHLFEHPYRSLHVFWYGAGEIVMPPCEMQGYYDVNGATVRIELEDGRWGFAKIMKSEFNGAPTSKIHKIAVVGASDLLKQPQGIPEELVRPPWLLWLNPDARLIGPGRSAGRLPGYPK